MELWNEIKAMCSTRIPDPIIVDHAPVAGDMPERVLIRKLRAAQKRHGKPFKCGAKGIPHEVIQSNLSRPDEVRQLERKGAK